MSPTLIFARALNVVRYPFQGAHTRSSRRRTSDGCFDCVPLPGHSPYVAAASSQRHNFGADLCKSVLMTEDRTISVLSRGRAKGGSGSAALSSLPSRGSALFGFMCWCRYRTPSSVHCFCFCCFRLFRPVETHLHLPD